MYRQIIFNGGAVCGLVYHMGVVSYLATLRAQRSRSFDWCSLRIFGVSAGTAAALLWLCDVPPAMFQTLFYSLIADSESQSRCASRITSIQQTMLAYITRTYSKRLRRIVVQRRFYIAISTAQGCKFTNRYSTVDEMLHLVMCSATIPFVCSYPSVWDGAYVCDGGFLIDGPATQAARLCTVDTLEVVSPIPLPLSLLVPHPVAYAVISQWSGAWAARVSEVDSEVDSEEQPIAPELKAECLVTRRWLFVLLALFHQPPPEKCTRTLGAYHAAIHAPHETGTPDARTTVPSPSARRKSRSESRQKIGPSALTSTHWSKCVVG